MSKSALGTILGATLLSLCKGKGSSSIVLPDEYEYEQKYILFPIQFRLKLPSYTDPDTNKKMFYGDLLPYIPVAIEMIQELWSRLIKIRPKCTKLHDDFNEAWGDSRILDSQMMDVYNKGLQEIQVTNEFGTVKLYDSFQVPCTFSSGSRKNAKFIQFFRNILWQQDAMCRFLPFPEWESEITEFKDPILGKAPWVDFEFKLDIPTHMFFLRQTEEQWEAYFNMILNTALQFVLLEFYHYHPNVLDSQKNWSFTSKNNFSNVFVVSSLNPKTDIHNMFSHHNPMKLRDR